MSIPTCLITGRVVGDKLACGDCEPCFGGEGFVPDAVKRLLAERDELMDKHADAMQEKSAADQDERAVHRFVQRFVEKWTKEFDLNKRDSAELNADLVMVIQAVHRDACRETHELLRRSLAVMPPPAFVTKTESRG